MKSLASMQRAYYGHQRQMAAQGAQTFTQTGKVLVTIPVGFTAAEASVTVSFVNTYTEEPCFTTGMALVANQPLIAGQYPTGSAVVYAWTTIDPPDAAPGTDPTLYCYTGAKLAIVVSGSPGQQIWVHYSFIGTGLSFPAPASPTNSTGNA